MSERIRDFRDLLVWQEAIELAVECDLLADALPARHWKLAGQIRSAANTVHAAIAEGNGSRTIPNYLRYLGMSGSSLNEIRSHLAFIQRRYPSIQQAQRAQRRLVRVDMLLKGLVRSLSDRADD